MNADARLQNGGPSSRPASTVLRGSLAIVVGASLWGLFWIPLRYLDDLGVNPFWAASLVMCGGVPFAALAAWKLGNARQTGFKWLAILGCGLGISTTLYFLGVVKTDVIRAIFLFYMLPIWATLCDRVLFGVKLHPGRAFAVAMAFAGLWLLLGGDGGVPLPRNVGDWAALCSGFCWGLTLSLIHSKPTACPHYSTLAALVCGTVLAGLIAISTGSPFPSSVALTSYAPLVIVAFGAIALWPSVLGQFWGARLVPATRAALLTMSEIIVATVSAALLIGSSLTPASILGGLVIIGAVLIDIFSSRRIA